MIELDLKPDTRKLRQFGLICLGGFGLIGLVVALKMGAFEEPGKWTIPTVLWALALICPILSFLAPKGLTPIYLILTLIAFPIGIILSNVILILFFLLMITPIALWFRVIGRDELKIKKASPKSSYWIKFPAGRGPESYYRQF